MRSATGSKHKYRRLLIYCLYGNRHKGGMTSNQALLWNHRKPICYAKRKTQAGYTCEFITNEHLVGG